MEAERRSTVSSLKGQLSNVEGSVKSMKAAVVVGSVLTVACLAAVFGVTVLANEVSKEVKVSNGTLTSKSGESVLTTSSVFTNKVSGGAQTLVLENPSVSLAVNTVVIQGSTKTVICDDLVMVQKAGAKDTFTVTEGSTLESVLKGDAGVEKRNLNMPAWLFWMVATGVINHACSEIMHTDAYETYGRFTKAVLKLCAEIV